MGQLLESHPLRDVLFGKLIPGGYDAAGIRILTKGTNVATQKAPKDGAYTLNGGRFLIKQGDNLPPGATFVEKSERPPGQRRSATSAPAAQASPAQPLDGNAIAEALTSAGFYMIKSEDLSDPVEGEIIGLSAEEQGEQLAESLRAAGYDLKATKPKATKPKAPKSGATETTQSPGPSETT